MITRRLHLPLDATARASAIAEAASVIRAGGLVAFPTETVYGLGAHALDAKAVEGVFRAKARPHWDPLIVHVSSRRMLAEVAASLPAGFEALAERFLPGPLTILVPKSPAVPDLVTAGRPTVAVRMPAHDVAHALIEQAGVPIAAPSANRFGHPSPTRVEHVLADLDGRIDVVLDGGPTRVGVESTVIDISANPPLILRPGGVPREHLEAVLGRVDIFRPPLVNVPRESLASPGAGIRHYAPRARLWLAETPASIAADVSGLLDEGLRVGVLLPEGVGVAALPPEVLTHAWGPWGEWDALAHELFAGLRALDAAGVDAIVCPMPDDRGLGLTLRDRLTKAARPRDDTA
jgi:L-threonylcarbamoyladenylate synthase